MPAVALLDERFALDADSFVELVIWQLDRPLAGCSHRFKYRLAYVVHGVCVVRYDNEAGKGDHRHAGRREHVYAFASLDTLQIDFWADVARWKDPS